MKSFEAIADICHNLLNEFPAAKEFRNYIDSRLSKENQKKFKIGYFPQSQYIDLLIREIGEETLIEAELIRKWEFTDSLCHTAINKPFFEDHPLIFPYRDAYGNIVGFIGRSLLPEAVRKEAKIIKYKNTDFKKGQSLFGLYEAKESILEQDSVYVVEGQFDVAKGHEVGFTNLVGLGNSQMTPYQFSILCRYTKNINLLLDNDEAGERGRKGVKNKFGSLATIRDWWIPDPYKDLDEYIQENKSRPALRIKK